MPAQLPFFFIGWAVLMGGGMLWLYCIREPSFKRMVLRLFSVTAAAGMLLFVWLGSGSVKPLAVALPGVVLVTVLNLMWTKVCDSCAAISRAQGFSAPKHCHKCGAELG